ncbi:unnamed protein product [Boreogadus saida]
MKGDVGFVLARGSLRIYHHPHTLYQVLCSTNTTPPVSLIAAAAAAFHSLAARWNVPTVGTAVPATSPSSPHSPPGCSIHPLHSPL